MDLAQQPDAAPQQEADAGQPTACLIVCAYEDGTTRVAPFMGELTPDMMADAESFEDAAQAGEAVAQVLGATGEEGGEAAAQDPDDTGGQPDAQHSPDGGAPAEARQLEAGADEDEEDAFTGGYKSGRRGL